MELITQQTIAALEIQNPNPITNPITIEGSESDDESQQTHHQTQNNELALVVATPTQVNYP